MVRVVLIRHGETEHNKDDAITGQIDVGLNEFGVQQAEKAAERLEKWSFDAAYSSDLERTYETVKIVAEKHDFHPESFKEFRERAFGEYEGRPKDEWRELVRNHDGDRHTLKADEGESLEEVGERFIGKLDELKEKHNQNDQVLVGGHSVAIKASIMKVLDLRGESYGKLELGNTALTVLESSDKYGWKLVKMNDTAHLE